MKVLVTGFSGFIGSYLVKRLNEINIELIVCDISNGIDICKWSDIKDFKDFDYIIHLANLSYVPASYQEPKKFYETNFISTLHMLELCRLNNAKLIYFSSYMYGHPQYQPIDENHPLQAYNPYSQTKLIAESLCEGYHRDFKIPITIFRPFNIYGKGQHPDFLIPTIINQAKTSKIIIKDDRPKRDYIHVNDIVDAVCSALLTHNEKSTLNIYNLGSGTSKSVKEIIDIVCQLSTHCIDYQCTNDVRPNEVMDTIADITKIKNELGWEPKVSLLEGLKSMIE